MKAITASNVEYPSYTTSQSLDHGMPNTSITRILTLYVWPVYGISQSYIETRHDLITASDDSDTVLTLMLKTQSYRLQSEDF